MGWFNYTSGDLAAFAAAYPQAVVVVSENDVERCVYNGQEAGRFIRVLAVDHQKVTEYRGLTLATAEHLKAGLTTFGKKDLVVRVGYTVTPLNILQDSYTAYYTARCPSLLGTEMTCAISRANEAAGYVLTVTENTTNWDTAIVGDYVTYSETGSGSAPRGDVRISWGRDES